MGDRASVLAASDQLLGGLTLKQLNLAKLKPTP